MRMNAVLNSVIYKPLEEFKSKYQMLHADNMNRFFEVLVKQSGVNIEENRATVDKYNEYKENLVKLKRKLNWMRFLGS